MTTPGRGLMPLLIDELVRLEGSEDDDLRAGARAFVGDRVRATSGVTRLGLTLAEHVTGLWIRAGSGGRAFAALDPAGRRAWTRRVTTTGAPLIADWSRMVRSLVLTFVYEERFGRDVRPGGRSAPAAAAVVRA